MLEKLYDKYEKHDVVIPKIIVAGIIGGIVVLIAIIVIYLVVPFLLTSPNPTLEIKGCKGNAGCFYGQVTRVIDGDTVVVNEVHVRFALASAPELTENGGVEAKNFLESLCPVGSRALVDEDDGQTGGSYGRTVAELYCNNKLANSALVEEGFGTIDKRFCRVSEFAKEEWAKMYGC